MSEPGLETGTLTPHAVTTHRQRVIGQAARDSLVLRHRDLEFSFCSRGCLLEFGDDPAWFLDAAYAPTML